MERGSHLISKNARKRVKEAFTSGVNGDFIKITTHETLEQIKSKGGTIITRKDLKNL